MERISLENPVDIPEPFRRVVIEWLYEYWDNLAWMMRNHFGYEFGLAETPYNDDDYLRLPVASIISNITRVAAGDTEDLDQAAVYEDVRGLVERLFGLPGQSSHVIPQAFWQSDFGAIVMAAFVWSQGDELITISEAAEISGKSVGSISQMAKRGKLAQYPDMRENNPRKRIRVLKSAIEKLSPQ